MRNKKPAVVKSDGLNIYLLSAFARIASVVVGIDHFVIGVGRAGALARRLARATATLARFFSRVLFGGENFFLYNFLRGEFAVYLAGVAVAVRLVVFAFVVGLAFNFIPDRFDFLFYAHYTFSLHIVVFGCVLFIRGRGRFLKFD